MTSIEILKNAKELVKEHWWTGSMAARTTPEGATEGWTPDDSCWCISGAVFKQMLDLSNFCEAACYHLDRHPAEVQQAFHALFDTIPNRDKYLRGNNGTEIVATVANYNDSHGNKESFDRRKLVAQGLPTPAPQAVLDWIDRAIALLEGDEKS